MLREAEDFFETIDWTALLFNLKKRKLVPFLGAGASAASSHDGKSTPTGTQLAKALADECEYPGSDSTNLLRVSQFYGLRFGEMSLRESVKKRIALRGSQPGKIHQIIAKWPVDFVLTTNYDNFMERAFAIAGKDPAKAIYDRVGDQIQIKSEPTVEYPLVYKFHGSLDNIDSMVITEDDYIDFLISLMKGSPKLPDAISQLFRTRSLLFIGYGLKDWNIRVLLRFFRKTDVRSFAVQQTDIAMENKIALKEWDSTVLYWEHNKISVYNCDALRFLKELDRRITQLIG